MRHQLVQYIVLNCSRMRGTCVQSNDHFIFAADHASSPLPPWSDWPQGAVVAQACHACTAALAEYASDTATQAYLDPENRAEMTKIILKVASRLESQQSNLSILQCDNDSDFTQLIDRLRSEAIDFSVWTERPEMVNTALALRPYPRPKVRHLFRNFGLLS